MKELIEPGPRRPGAADRRSRGAHRGDRRGLPRRGARAARGPDERRAGPAPAGGSMRSPSSACPEAAPAACATTPACWRRRWASRAWSARCTGCARGALAARPRTRSARLGRRPAGGARARAERRRSSCTTRSSPTPTGACRCSSARTLAALRRSGLPLVTILHEFAYPWRPAACAARSGRSPSARRCVGVMRGSAAVVVTAPFRARVARAPALAAAAPSRSRRCSRTCRRRRAVPPPAEAERATGRAVRLRLRGRRGRRWCSTRWRCCASEAPALGCELLGAPGAGSPAAEEWLAGARAARDRAAAVVLGRAARPGALRRAGRAARCCCTPNPPARPRARARSPASLASGTAGGRARRPAALAGAGRREARAGRRADAAALADALATLLADDAAARGARGARSAFAGSAMGLERSARVVKATIEDLPGAAAGARRPDRQPVAGSR